MATPYGLGLAGIDYTNIPEDEFNDWYDTEHIPERRIEGVLNAHRWLGVDNPRISIVTYDMESLAVRDSEKYRSLLPPNVTPWTRRIQRLYKRVCHFVAEQELPGRVAAPEGAGAMVVHAMNVPEGAEAEFMAWSAGERIPLMAKVPGCLSARSFLVRAGVQRHLFLYHLASPGVCETPAWKEAFDLPRRDRMGAQFQDELRLAMRAYVRKA